MTEEFVGKGPDDDVGGATKQFENAHSTTLLLPIRTINHPLPAMAIFNPLYCDNRTLKLQRRRAVAACHFDPPCKINTVPFEYLVANSCVQHFDVTKNVTITAIQYNFLVAQ